MFDVDRIWWIALSCIVTTVLGFAFGDLRAHLQAEREARQRDLKEEAKQMQLYCMALRYLLKNRLTEMCEQLLHRGQLSSYHRELVIEMRDIYHELGGNSYITALTDKVLDLPHTTLKGGEKHD